jgi:hypothetical protein
MKKDLVILFLLIFPAIGILFQKGYFTMHDDLQSMRQYQMDKCFQDGQIPCRWVTDMGYGYGYPLFNFYPPLPYYLGQIFRWFGFAYIDIVKIIGIIGFALTAVFMYLLGREFWGRLGGLVSAAFLTYAPYHSVDFYVRGAMNEFWALAFYPAVFLTIYKLISTGRRYWIPLVSLSVAGIMLSHNQMLLIFSPLIVAWVVLWWVRLKSVRSLFSLTLSAVFALGLAGFYTLPVLFEQKYAHVETLVIGYFNYLAHYLDLNQIFLRINWGYGSSVLGPGDTMSFALGYLQWIIPALILIALPFNRRLRSHFPIIIFSLVMLLSSLYMTHSKSTWIWQLIHPLEFLQFPWRFLTVSIFAASLLSGAVVLLLPRKLIPVLLFALVLLNAAYFRPDKWLPDITDAQKFSGASWHLLITSGIFDYLPIYAPHPPADPPGGDLDITSGTGSYYRLAKRSNYQAYSVDVSSPSAVAELQTYYFPGWKIWVDGRLVSVDPSRDPLLGRMKIDLSSGSHQIVAKFTNTPVRTLGNIFSLISWVMLIAIMAVWMRKLRWAK